MRHPDLLNDEIVLNRDGSIDRSESEMLTAMLEEQHQVEFQFESVDSNSDGSITDREYVAYDSELNERERPGTSAGPPIR